MTDLQWIVVDDTDPRIEYSGPWSTQGQSILDDMGQFGAPFLLTSHGTTTNASLSFTFSGSQLVVAGSQLVPNDVNTSGGTCTVDGIAQQITYTTENATNRVGLCRFTSLSSSSSHTLVLDAVPAERKPFWLDYIKYLPTPSVPMNNEYVQILTDNQNILFDANWVNGAPENIAQVATNVTNSVMSYAFVGTSIAWYGSYNHSTSLLPANLSYTIDENNPITVKILPSTKAQFNITMEQLLFNASGLLPGVTHRLRVTYLGNPQSVPLAFNNFIVTSGPAANDSSNATPTTSGTISTSPTNKPVTSPVSNHSNPKTFKIAMTVSFIGATIILGALVLFVVVRRRRRQSAVISNGPEMSQDVSPRPFDAPSTTNFDTKRGNTTPAAEFVPISKTQVGPAGYGHVSSPDMTTASTGSSTPQVSIPFSAPAPSAGTESPVDRDTATHLWNLLLRYRHALAPAPSVGPSNNPGSGNSVRQGDESVDPPAYAV